MAKRVLVPIAEGIEEIEAVCIIDILRRAEADVTVASVGDIQITASRGVKIVADVKISDCKDQSYDLIVLPGGLPGAEYLRDSGELIEMLKQQKQQGKLYAAICASPAVVLQYHGLLDGVSKATCYPSLADKLGDKARKDERVVIDGNCVTAQGPGVALEFGIELVEILFGREKAKQVADAMVMGRN